MSTITQRQRQESEPSERALTADRHPRLFPCVVVFVHSMLTLSISKRFHTMRLIVSCGSLKLLEIFGEPETKYWIGYVKLPVTFVDEFLFD